jgi:hypothetical protein
MVETASCNQQEGSGAYPCYWDLSVSVICGGILHIGLLQVHSYRPLTVGSSVKMVWHHVTGWWCFSSS